MIHILNAEPYGYCQAARKIMQGIGAYEENSLNRYSLLACLGTYNVLITRLGFQIDREMIDAGRNLSFIVTATTGLDHIDLEYARQRGITVLSLRGETEFLRTISATAEHTWGLLLALLRHIPQAFSSVIAGDWRRDSFRGHELEGHRLGILGLGRIGSKVATYGIAFGMKIFAYDPYRVDWMEDGVERCESLGALAANSDVLSLHIPLKSETIGLISTAQFKLLPPQALLVNTSRAEIVDQEALLTALEEDILAGAALDFIPAERDPCQRQSSPLLAYARTHDNLLITPHLGGATFESMAKTEIFMAKKLRAHLNPPTE